MKEIFKSTSKIANLNIFYLLKSNLLLILFISILFSSISTGNVDYKSYELDSTPKDLLWCGSTREVVLILTETNSLYRSEDKGFTWRLLNDILLSKGKDELDPDENEIGKVAELIKSPVDKNMVIFLGTHGINWITEDCGRKVKALNHGRKIQEFIFHPTERSWVLASAYTLCSDFQNEPCKKYKEIFSTQDLGENWNLLLPYVVQFGWGVVSEKQIKKGIPKERIFITYEPRGKGDQKNIGWNYKVDMIYTDDFLRTRKVACHKCNKFLLTEDYLFAAQVVDQELQEVSLLVADPNLHSYSFEPIIINNGRFIEHSYTFVDTTEGSVFLHINHFGQSSKYGHVYSSDSKGLKYSLSLPNNIRSYDNQCDFDKLFGMDGIYIANSIDAQYMRESLDNIQREAIEEEERMDGKKAHHNVRNKGSIDQNHEDKSRDFVTTLISFNKGGLWERIKASKTDINGREYDCEDFCYLNLHGISGDFPPYYSVDSAAGILLANGNVGEYLSHDPEDISTFLSRDGGITWFEVKQGSHTYEIGDHGGLIVIADDQKPTNMVYFSWDEGLHWQSLKVSNDPINIKNIIIEPTSTALHFVIYGETSMKKGKKAGIVIGLNFATYNEAQCKNAEHPDTPESDYETWSPGDNNIDANGGNSKCLLGRKTIYVRRKRDSECYNGLDYERKTVVQNCECTDKDYECDEGFHRPNINERCIPVNPEKVSNYFVEGEMHKPPENCKDYFAISKGYRKVPGNSCMSGVNYDPIIIPCPYSGFFSFLGIVFFALIICTLAGLILLAFNKDFIERIGELISNNRAKYDKSGIRDNISSRDIINSSDIYTDLTVRTN